MFDWLFILVGVPLLMCSWAGLSLDSYLAVLAFAAISGWVGVSALTKSKPVLILLGIGLGLLFILHVGVAYVIHGANPGTMIGGYIVWDVLFNPDLIRRLGASGLSVAFSGVAVVGFNVASMLLVRKVAGKFRS